ncbi:MAG: ATP-binding protein [Saccharospirillaceae bacterium]|nr:ATP-binding protein [Pseudomonadales bacterium]NRB79930.1 ATP-binding protein [Saccharospirillaceae bacterium]
MDQNTLSSLKLAFTSAPSSELAKILILNSFSEKIELFLSYLTHLSLPLEDTETCKIAEHLLKNQCPSQALTLLNEKSPEQCLLIVKAFIAMQQNLQALKLYSNLIQEFPKLESSELNTLLNHKSCDEQTSKPKLRIIEKNTVTPIFDLTADQLTVTNFSDVVGLSAIKKQIHKKIILPFQKPSLFQRFKKKVGGGVLLYGPPGCGKTLLARATAGECNANFYNIDISDVLDMYIGESENKLHIIFEKARNNTPCVLFFDELEALAGKREYNKGNASNIVSQFLTELDGFSQNNEGVLILASTNVPWSIDSAFLRPGRFDRMFFISPPDKIARHSILEHYLKDRPTDNNIDTQAIAKKTSGFSGADIANLIDVASDEAIDETIETGLEVNISYQHMKEALKNTRSTTTEWLTTARNYARYANDGGRYDDVLEFLKKHGK